MAAQEEEGDAWAALLERHRHEIKELKAAVQKLKHAVPKGDRARQKEAAAKIAALEAELHDRHAREEKEAKAAQRAAATVAEPVVPNAAAPPPTTAGPAAMTAATAASVAPDSDDDGGGGGGGGVGGGAGEGGRRVTKASKRRVRGVGVARALRWASG
jgi:hypothetical protein